MELQYITQGLNEASEKISKYITIQPEIPLWATLVGIGLTTLAVCWIYKEFRKPESDEDTTYKKPIF
jgi:hypothetical protein